MSVQQSIDNISNLAKSLNSMFYERQDEVRILLLALCSKEHVFLLGEAGVGKSLIVEAIAKSMDNRYFDILLGKDSKENLKSLKKKKSKQFQLDFHCEKSKRINKTYSKKTVI